MTIQLDVHLERAGDDIAWWGASDQVPGFTACADSLAELRDLTREALWDLHGRPVSFTERLVGGPVVIIGLD